MKASIIFNPHAGPRSSDKQIKQAGKLLADLGWAITWRETERAGHATELAQLASEAGDDVAIAVGGDGTINEVINGLVDSQTALGILPAGTGNVFAVDMHIPTPTPLGSQSLLKAAKQLAQGQKRAVDVGKATFSNGLQRYFLLWSGVGLDAAISQVREEDLSQNASMKSLGMATWLVTAFFVVQDFRGTRMEITTDDQVINRRVVMATINNSQLYARFWRLSPDAKLDDGLLDLVVMEGYGFRSTVKHGILATLRRHVQSPQVHVYRTKKVVIETKEPMPVHLDAENMGATPVTIEVVPRALNVILPQNAPDSHFSN